MEQLDPSFWKWMSGITMAAFSTLYLWAWTHTHSLVKAKADAASVQVIADAVKANALTLAADIKAKADFTMVGSIIDRLELIVLNNREDNKSIIDQITRIVELHNDFSLKCMQELGKRPTREECQIIWHKDKA